MKWKLTSEEYRARFEAGRAARRAGRDLALTLARKVKWQRIERGWTQEDISRDAGMSHSTYRVFEMTGQIAASRLLSLLVLLGEQRNVAALLPCPPRFEEDTRQRGRKKKNATASGLVSGASAAFSDPRME